jgi:hypothetical protein
MIVEIKMISIGTTKITPKNRSELVFFGCLDRKRPVLGGPVRSPQYLGRSWTGCGPRLRVLGTKNRTEPDFKTLITTNGDMHCRPLFGCHIADSDVAPGIHVKKTCGGGGRRSRWWVFSDCGGHALV